MKHAPAAEGVQVFDGRKTAVNKRDQSPVVFSGSGFVDGGCSTARARGGRAPCRRVALDWPDVVRSGATGAADCAIEGVGLGGVCAFSVADFRLAPCLAGLPDPLLTGEEPDDIAGSDCASGTRCGLSPVSGEDHCTVEISSLETGSGVLQSVHSNPAVRVSTRCWNGADATASGHTQPLPVRMSALREALVLSRRSPFGASEFGRVLPRVRGAAIHSRCRRPSVAPGMTCKNASPVRSMASSSGETARARS